MFSRKIAMASLAAVMTISPINRAAADGAVDTALILLSFAL